MEQTQHPSLLKRVLFLLVDKHDDRTEVGTQEAQAVPSTPLLALAIAPLWVQPGGLPAREDWVGGGNG